MPVRISGDILTRRPVEQVFDFVAGERNEPHRNPAMRRAEKISESPHLHALTGVVINPTARPSVERATVMCA